MTTDDRAPSPAAKVGERILRVAGRAVAAVIWQGPRSDARWPYPRGRRLTRWLTVLFVVYGLIVAGAAAGAVFNDDARMVGGLAFLMLLPFVAALWLVNRRPLDAWRLMAAWVLVLPFLVGPPVPSVPVLEVWEWLFVVPVVLLAAWAGPAGVSLAVGGLTVALLGVLTLVSPWPVEASYLWGSVLVVAVVVAVGMAFGARWDARRALEAERIRVAEAQAERGALAERARIAREMHDVVAHHMSMIAVRCETAPYRLGELPENARAELAEVAAAAREALGDLQNLLGVLRSSNADGAERAPQPGTDQLETLLSDARAAGADVSWEIDPGGPVPAPLGLTVYRIVQQGLANAAQHAAGAPVRVRVARSADVLVVVVENDAGTGPDVPGGGQGLRGMRERVEVHGGTLHAEQVDAGFRLRAELPIGGRP
ncbi:sensor histidine kinase [Pseudonocardia dioxanivorans]|uniref:sensor histidine kinase n=1 Tax=Pseudonocardia dioxanivorans TaxID=240495 RepID=UPI000CD2808F|nr:histidine kinase [Pseudonocardia dioxanivorans]